MYDAAEPRPRIADAPGPASSPPAIRSAPMRLQPDAEPDGTFVSRMTFTGCGGEYFRIWVVNLFLSIVTLGIYSAWAKVRKTRYFWQNARLVGYVFDFHGNPVAILRGRIVALLLLVAYSWGFEFSLTAGLVTIAVLLAAGPWLFVKAQQFKFGNTSFRGLRFGFAAPFATGYRVVFPILVVWFSTTVVAALVTKTSIGIGMSFGVVSIVSLLLIPGMHHRLKAFQHDYATYGDRRFEFRPALGAFYWVYIKGLAFVALGGIAGSVLVGAVLMPVMRRTAAPDAPSWLWYATGVGTAVITYVVAWPYLAARLQQVVWSHTRIEDVRFRTEIAAWPLFKLVLRNVALTLVTCGLYWPFAAVALARYRVECMRVDADAPLADVAAGTFARASVAVGDAAADTFGMDLGL